VTSHLSPAEGIDALDGALSPNRRAHLDECPRCRALVVSYRQFLEPGTEVVASYGTEEHERLAAFRERLAGADRRGRCGRTRTARVWLPRLAWGGAVAAAVVAGLVAFVPHRVPSGAAAPRAMPAVAPLEASADVESDHAWTLLTTVGGDLDEESAVDALHPAPDTVDEAVGELDPDERAVLAALLRDELKPRS
jgi:hypothetical protein